MPTFLSLVFLAKTAFKNESLSSALCSLVNFVPHLICSGDLLSLARCRLPPAGYIGISAPSSVTLCAAQSSAGFSLPRNSGLEGTAEVICSHPNPPRAGSWKAFSCTPAQGYLVSVVYPQGQAAHGPQNSLCHCRAALTGPRFFQKGGTDPGLLAISTPWFPDNNISPKSGDHVTYVLGFPGSTCSWICKTHDKAPLLALLPVRGLSHTCPSTCSTWGSAANQKLLPHVS